MLTLSATIPQNGQTHSSNCLSMFDHFVGLVLKGLKRLLSRYFIKVTGRPSFTQLRVIRGINKMSKQKICSKDLVVIKFIKCQNRKYVPKIQLYLLLIYYKPLSKTFDRSGNTVIGLYLPYPFNHFLNNGAIWLPSSSVTIYLILWNYIILHIEYA